MHVNYFFINFTLKTKESQCFCLIFFNVNIEKFYLVEIFYLVKKLYLKISHT